MIAASTLAAVPANARILLDLIASVEAGLNDQYNVVYGHHEKDLTKPITSMTLAELITNQSRWGKMWGSSAAGRYQIMPQTLSGLIGSLGLAGADIFTPALQDALGYNLLLRRGYASFIDGTLSTIGFGKALAQEWASFPVLADTVGAHGPIKAGQSYYSGDALNKALLSPAHVESTLADVQAYHQPASVKPAPNPAPVAPKPPTVPANGWAVIIQTIIKALASIFNRRI